VREFVPTERLALEAFDGYALGRPVVDEVEVRFIADANTLVANLIAGEVHFTIGPGLAVDQSLQAQERWPGGKMGVFPYQGGTVARPQFLNPQPAAQLDLRFRRALYHAIDREVLNESITRGYAPTSGYQVPPGAPEFDVINSSVVQYPFDPRRAAQLLEDAGLTRVDDSYRDAAGNELTVEVQVAGSDTGQEQAALFIADSWQRVGIRGTLKLLSAAAATREARATRPAFEISSFSIATRQPARVIWYHSSDIPTAENRYRGGNFSRYANPELDSLVDRFYTTVPREERIESLRQIARLVTDQVVVMPLYHNVHASLISNRVSNVTPRTGQAQTFGAHKWDIQ
jgi:peptide/nickel transport system substrate-binding protein